MASLLAPLIFAARHGRWCLVLGILAGLSLSDLAQTLRPWVPHMLAALLCLSAFRIGPKATLRGFDDLRGSLGVLLAYQIAAPLVVLALAWVFGMAALPAVMALALLLSAPSVTGNPNFTILMGEDPSAALRLLMVGTALFPLTALPVLFGLPALGEAWVVVMSALRLMAVILGAVGLAFVIRWIAVPEVPERVQTALDGASAILLAVVVIGLMSAAGPALLQTPGAFAAWLGFACLVNLGAQLAAMLWLRRWVPPQDRVATAVVAGNRNIALFLVALPPAVSDQILLFIGVYQVPMYLTPLLMGRFLVPLANTR